MAISLVTDRDDGQVAVRTRLADAARNGPVRETRPMHESDETEHRTESEKDGNAGSGTDDYPNETVMAVEPTETNAGVQHTRYDIDDVDGTFVPELREYYPPGDGVEGESISVRGDRPMLQLLSTMADLVADRFEGAPRDGVRKRRRYGWDRSVGSCSSIFSTISWNSSSSAPGTFGVSACMRRTWSFRHSSRVSSTAMGSSAMRTVHAGGVK